MANPLPATDPTTMSDRYLLTLIVPANLEEILIDWLLENAPDQGFCSFPVSGHSISHSGLSASEQVSGRKRQIRFDIGINSEETDQLIKGVKSRFSGIGIEFWITPQHRAGYL